MRMRAPLALLAIMAALCGAARAAAPIYVSGRALIAGANGPAGGVTIAMYTPGQDDPVDITQTLQNGSYILKAPRAGRYRVTAAGSMYEDFSKSVDVPPAGLSSLQLQLRHLPSVRLRLLSANGKPISAAGADGWIWIYRHNTDDRRRHRAGANVLGLKVDQAVDPDGALEMTLPRGIRSYNVDRILIGVRSPQNGYGERQIDDWPDTPLTLKLTPGATLNGLVRESHGNPAGGVSVSLIPRFEDGWVRMRRGFATVVSDSEGHFQIAALPPGTYRIMARSPDGRRYSDSVTLDDGRTHITLDPSDG